MTPIAKIWEEEICVGTVRQNRGEERSHSTQFLNRLDDKVLLQEENLLHSWINREKARNVSSHTLHSILS